MKKYRVYYNDEVNAMALCFEAETIEECKTWIVENVDEKDLVQSCDTDVDNTSRTYYYEVYEGEPVVVTVDEDGYEEREYNDPIYSSPMYWNND